ncbi:MAG TPA: triose-phosphate isomerase [Alphaproteobacteria bacterium]|nr:triose-phosphate isomerase [Alphaproteobacteria bacterium]
MPRRALIVGNWKMNGLGHGGAGLDGPALAAALRDKLDGGNACRGDLVLCPPATLVARIAAVVAGSAIAVGGQDCHAAASGAHTGDISAEMLADAGCRYVIVGHSERRADHGESDAIVRAKAAAAHRAGLTAILCVGESEAERDAGRALEVVGAQLAGSLPPAATAANTVIAYEPVWAIGSGRTPTPAEIGEVHGFLRRALKGRVDEPGAARLLYGGSVKAANAAAILAIGDVDGALVGGASLKAEEFWAIAQSAPAATSP